MTLPERNRYPRWKHIKKILAPWGLGVLVLFASAWLFLSVYSTSGQTELVKYLTTQLTKTELFEDNARTIPSNTVIYVLGGSQRSLKERFKTASQLYHWGLGKKILFLSRPGITEYDPALGRNLTNDEWSLKQLTGRGVKPDDMEPVSFTKSLFGTLTEANGLSEIAALRGYRQVVLVTSRCHTKRTWITFSKMFENRNIPIAIYASNDSEGLGDLLYEYLKLVLYKNIVLPYYAEQKPIAASGVVHAR